MGSWHKLVNFLLQDIKSTLKYMQNRNRQFESFKFYLYFMYLNENIHVYVDYFTPRTFCYFYILVNKIMHFVFLFILLNQLAQAIYFQGYYDNLPSLSFALSILVKCIGSLFAFFYWRTRALINLVNSHTLGVSIRAIYH